MQHTQRLTRWAATMYSQERTVVLLGLGLVFTKLGGRLVKLLMTLDPEAQSPAGVGVPGHQEAAVHGGRGGLPGPRACAELPAKEGEQTGGSGHPDTNSQDSRGAGLAHPLELLHTP